MGGGDLNLKKSWHPSTMKNMEKVWKAEQQDHQERKRIAELKREIEMEKDKEDMTKFAMDQGVIEKKDDKKLDWMYKGPNQMVNREDYLLGKPIDKPFEQMAQAEKDVELNRAPKNHVEYECIPPSLRFFSGSEQVDLARKLQEDPLYAIKKKEMETKSQLLKNPVRLKQLRDLLEQQSKKSKGEKKGSKKDKKKKRSKSSSSEEDSDGDLDNLLAKKYKKLKSKIDEDYLLKSMKKLKKEKKKRAKGKRRSSSSSSNSSSDVSDSNSDSEESEEEEKSRREKHKKVSKNDDRETRRKECKKKHKSSNRSVSAERSKSNKHKDSKKRKSRRTSSSDDEEEEKEDEASKKRRKSKEKESQNSPERRHKSRNSPERRHKSPNSPERKHKSPKSPERRHKSPDSPERRHKPEKSEKRERSPRRHTNGSSRDARGSDDDERRRDPPKVDYGLMRADRTRVEPSSRSDSSRSSKTVHSKSSKQEEKRRWVPPKRHSLTEEEKEQRRREMMANATVRDRERENNVKRYREQEKKEQVDKTYNKDFIRKQLAVAAEVGTVESRIRANINNIQRSGRAMDTNFAKR